jgi:glutaredoxin
MIKIMIYALSTCPWCKKTKRYFADKNIPFDFIDYDLATEDDRAWVRNEFNKRNLDLSFPKVFIGEKVISGYRPEEFEKVLEEIKGA